MNSKQLSTSIIFTALMIAGQFSIMASIGSPVDQPQGVFSAYTTHAPINIVGNTGFLGANTSTGISSGNGTASNPYIIEGWFISVATSSGIEISNSDMYFIIRSSFISHGAYAWEGIYLYNCHNGTVIGNKCYDNANGIRLEGSSSNVISNNICDSECNDWPDPDGAIYLHSSSGNTICNNTCSNNDCDISLVSSDGNTICNNTCNSDNFSGITLVSSNGNNISNNNCDMAIVSSSGNAICNNTCPTNNYYGIYLSSSSTNILINNTCSNGYSDGIEIDGSDGNTISNNTCNSNDECGIRITDSCDNSISNNVCSDNWYGIRMWYSCNSNTVNNNTCSFNDDGGFYLDGSSSSCNSNSICNNNCSNNAGNGIGIGLSYLNAVSNNTCNLNNGEGIILEVSSGNTISNNTCSNNYDGICIDRSDGNTISNNTCNSNNLQGIRLYDYSSSNTISCNNCSSNNGAGIGLATSDGNTLSNNVMFYNGIVIKGYYLSNWNTQNIDTSNTVNGNPVYYYKNQNGITIPADAAQVILSNCLNFIIENRNLSNASIGIALGFCNNCIISNNSCDSNNDCGIYLCKSNNNSLMNNTCSNGCYVGICIEWSDGNTISNNTCNSNDLQGIRLYDYSSGNTISCNTCSSNNDCGIYLDGMSNSNTLTNNSCCSNNKHGIYLGSSCNNNMLSNNTCTNNKNGIYLCEYSSNSDLLSNNCSSNNHSGINLDWMSNSNTLTNNSCCSNFHYGIYLYCSDSNIIDLNQLRDNVLEGIYIDSAGSNNWIWNNTFTGNLGTVGVYNTSCIQARDNGSGNQWNSSSGFGNYWGDWTSPDSIAPWGIIDVPYNITGSAGAKDYYPRAFSTCMIIAPTSNTIYYTTSATVNLSGTVSGSISVSSVNWTNLLTGDSGIATGTTNWTIIGIALSAGSNLIYVNSSDAKGNEGSDMIIVVRDNTAPICVINSPTTLLTYNTSSSTISLGGTASDNILVALVTWKNMATGASDTATGTTSWTITGIALNAGSNLIYVNASDEAGNKASGTITVVRDDTMPTCVINSPTTQLTYNTTVSTIDLSGIASDNILVSQVTWKNTATGISGIASGMISWTISGVALNAGSNTIYVNASDPAGNIAVDTITVVRDNTAPTCAINSPTSLSTYNTTASTINLGGTASDNIGVISVKWKNMATGASGTASGTTSWSVTGISLNAGNNLIYVNSSDAASNKATDTITVVRDNTAPTCAINSPTSLSTYNTTASTIDLGGTSSDNIIVALVTWKNMATGSSGTSTGTTSWIITGITVNAGSNLIYVNASDAAGNKASDVVTVVRDNTAPTCVIDSPTTDSTYSTNVATINLCGNASDNLGVSTVNWSNVATGASGTATGTTSWTITGIALNPGINLIYVNSTDTVGNKESNNITVTYTPPVELTVTGTVSPKSGMEPLSVSFTCTPSGGDSPYTYSWDFGDGGSSAQKNPSHKYNSTGTFTVTVTVTDNASHTAEWNTTITVTSNGGGGTVSDDSGIWLVIGLLIVVFSALLIVFFLSKRKKEKERGTETIVEEKIEKSPPKPAASKAKPPVGKSEETAPKKPNQPERKTIQRRVVKDQSGIKRNLPPPSH